MRVFHPATNALTTASIEFSPSLIQQIMYANLLQSAERLYQSQDSSALLPLAHRALDFSQVARQGQIGGGSI